MLIKNAKLDLSAKQLTNSPKAPSQASQPKQTIRLSSPELLKLIKLPDAPITEEITANKDTLGCLKASRMPKGLKTRFWAKITNLGQLTRADQGAKQLKVAKITKVLRCSK